MTKKKSALEVLEAEEGKGSKKMSALEILEDEERLQKADKAAQHDHDHSHHVVEMDDGSGHIPVTVLTGFLGAGKTTLLNHILTVMHGKKIAVIENELGAVGVDDDLLAKNTRMQAEDEIIEMINGCICCNVRSDLIEALGKLGKRVERKKLKLDGIVIEMTGMADPAPVAQTFFVDESVRKFARLDGIITLVDAKHLEMHLDEKKPDGAENESVAQLAFADRILLNKVDLVEEADLDRIEARIRTINHFAPIQRCEKSKVSVDSVLNIGGFDLKRTLQMAPEFLDEDAKFQHDQSVTSVAIRQDGEMDLDMVQRWMGHILERKGEDIYRMKGVLSIAHADQRFVYQGVHMLFNGNFEEPWRKDDKRQSKMVFIGKNLDHDELKSGFAGALATPENIEKKRSNLRFGVGDKVQCNTEKGWEDGEVIAQLYREEQMPPGMVAPYQVKLKSGGLIFAPADHDQIIRPHPDTAASF